jgi:hypothetical protein
MLTLLNAFTHTEIAAAVNIIPNAYGRLQELNLFPVRGVTSSDVAVEEQNGSLALIPSEAIGGPGRVGTEGKRKLRSFRVPRLVYDEHINPHEVNGIRAFGGDLRLNMATLLNQKLGTARGKHDITLEHLRMGALKGTILDADGSTVLYNLYTEFGITQKTVDFVLGTAGTEVRDKCHEVVRWVEDNLLGERMSGVRVLVSPEFFDKLVKHAKVKEAFANYQEASNRLGGDMRRGFTFGGLTFEEYRGTATGSAGTAVRFIAANDGHAFPEGTLNTFATLAAPADFNETVNTLGQVYYAKVQPAPMDRGYNVHTQSNVLPLCMRPGVLVRVFSSN